MNIRSLLKLAVAACTVLTIFGCGGGGGGTTASNGGGGGGGGGGVTPPTPAAVLTLSIAGQLPAGTSIGGVDVTMNLPAGVTCKADADGTAQAGTVTASGVAANGTPVAKFTAPSGQLRIAVIKAQGFTTGEFATANLDFTGTAPAASGFTVVGAPVVSDLNGNPITGLTVTSALQIK